MTDRDGAVLDSFWARVAARLERNGMRPRGRLALDGLDRGERHALAGLLGRPVAADRVTVDLSVLDERIRSSGVAPGLVALVERHAGPLVDRIGTRQRHRDARQQVWDAGRAELSAVGLDGGRWVEAWLEEVRRSGALGRIPPERAGPVLATAVHCIAQLPVLTSDPVVGRGDLASRVAGDAHALDDGTMLAAVVLRAAAAITALPYPLTPAGRRDLWRAAGVQTDEVSTTVLTIGLRSVASDAWLDDRTAAGWETHLSLRDLRRIDPQPPSGGRPTVFVCENPRVLEMALDAGCRASALCTQGQPSVAVTTLLKRLRSRGAELHYHGDFDWPGVTIANGMVATHDCMPWRMSTVDYHDGLSRLAPLVGDLPLLGESPVVAMWDNELAPAMAAARRAIHEELVLDDLLADMTAGQPPG
jgi:uncharacterized protein (TIGR02679 family)